jgi:hypothetical protein
MDCAWIVDYSSLCQIFARKATQPSQSRTLSEFSVPLLPECHVCGQNRDWRSRLFLSSQATTVSRS